MYIHRKRLKELAHVIVEAWRVQNLIGEAYRPEIQERVTIRVQRQSALEPCRANLADGVQRQTHQQKPPLAKRGFWVSILFCSGLQLIG